MANKRMIDATFAQALTGAEPIWVWQNGTLCQSTVAAQAAVLGGGSGGGSGTHIWSGSGVPGTIAGQANGDFYFDTSGTGNVYKLNGTSWSLLFNILGPAGSVSFRVASGTTDTPTTTDNGSTIEYTNASAITVSVNYLGAGATYNIIQTGNGQVTMAAGAGVTLVSSNSSPSFQPSAKYGMLNVYCTSTSGVVAINGRMV